MAALHRKQMLPNEGQQRNYSGGERAPDRRVAVKDLHYEHYQADVDEITIRSIGHHDQGAPRPRESSPVLAARMLNRGPDHATGSERDRVPNVEVVNQHLVHDEIENQRDSDRSDIS